jgi:anti-anti-sigma regulatory factor
MPTVSSLPTDYSLPTDSSFPDGDGERLDFALRLGGRDPERVIFFLAGHLVGPVCPGFENFTRTCVEGGTRRLRLDLSDLQSLDLDGVNSLLRVRERLTALGGRLLLTNANAHVMSVLRLFAEPLLATETSVVLGAGAARSVAQGRSRLARSRQSLAG